MVLCRAGPAALMAARVFVTFLLCPMVLGIAVLPTLQTLIHWSVARGISPARMLPRYHLAKPLSRRPSGQGAEA